jgi:putative transposase
MDQKSGLQFITFRTKESVDSFVAKIYSQNLEKSKEEYLIDKYLDSSKSGAYFYGEVTEIMKKRLLLKEGDLYKTHAFSIMPNHVHLLILQIESLSKIVKYVKGGTAFEINRELGRSGAFWHKNYFDKAIRDDEHYEKVYRYILENPRNLEDREERVFGIWE